MSHLPELLQKAGDCFRLSVFFMLVCLPGCSASKQNPVLNSDLQRLLSAPALTVFLLDPELDKDQDGLARGGNDHFHGYKIIKEAVFQNEAQRRRLLAPLQVALDAKPPNGAACFSPRHGLRAVAGDYSTIDYLICFECKLIYIYENGKTFTTVSSSAHKAFDDFLNEFGKHTDEN